MVTLAGNQTNFRSGASYYWIFNITKTCIVQYEQQPSDNPV